MGMCVCIWDGLIDGMVWMDGLMILSVRVIVEWEKEYEVGSYCG